MGDSVVGILLYECVAPDGFEIEWIGGLPTIQSGVQVVGYDDSLGSELTVLCMPDMINDIHANVCMLNKIIELHF